jgi:hypothetical protein
MMSTSLLTWHVTTGNIVIKFFSLPESERREFMMTLARELKYKELREAKETECAARGVSPCQLSIENVSSSDDTVLEFNEPEPRVTNICCHLGTFKVWPTGPGYVKFHWKAWRVHLPTQFRCNYFRFLNYWQHDGTIFGSRTWMVL